MSITIRDYQGRVNGILKHERLKVDGMMGPNTREGIQQAMKYVNVGKKQDLFDRGVRGIVWHWTASFYDVSDYDKKHYNYLHDYKGNTYDGGHTIAEQVNYDWRKGVGASHTKMMNTGWIGQSCSAMGDATGWPMYWGTAPLTWDMIDAMLEQSADLIEEYGIPAEKWNVLSHAEVQETLGIAQRGKWDFMVLPGDTQPRNPVDVGDDLRKRMKDKFL